MFVRTAAPIEIASHPDFTPPPLVLTSDQLQLAGGWRLASVGIGVSAGRYKPRRVHEVGQQSAREQPSHVAGPRSQRRGGAAGQQG